MLTEFKKILNINDNLDLSKIKNIKLDSRLIEKDDIFVALKGQTINGNDFILEAKEKKVKLIITDNKKYKNEQEHIFYLEGLKNKLPLLAKIFYKDLPQNIVAVTGTNGKTSVTQLLSQIFAKLNIKAATIGTLGAFVANKKIKNLQHTTPDIFSFYGLLAEIKKTNCDYLFFEASSHAIEQNRFAGINIDIALFTNLSQDHLDYHKNMENYFVSKSKLFVKFLKKNGIAIINYANKKYAEKLIKLLDKNKQIIIINKKNSNLYIEDKHLIYKEKKYDLKNRCFKKGYQLENLLSAMSIALQLNINIDDIIKIIPELQAIEGRMEKFTLGVNINVYVDFAHTPDALLKILQEVKNNLLGKIILVFGCGGDRDKGKRKIMGEIAYKNSDIVIITNDNPRNESAEQIRNEIVQNCQGAFNIADRKKAIILALDKAQTNDVVIIAGKGHENYQIIKDKKIEFSDQKVIKEYVANKRN